MKEEQTYQEKACKAIAAAWRGCWSDFDGRSLRDQIDEAFTVETQNDLIFFLERWGICHKCNSWEE